MMTLGTKARIVLVGSVGLCVPFAVALAQDDPDSSDRLETGTAQDEDERGFWDWVNENIEIEYPDDPSENPGIREPGGGGGGDSGGGGGHGG